MTKSIITSICFLWAVSASPVWALSDKVDDHLATARQHYRHLRNEQALDEIARAHLVSAGSADDVAISLLEEIVFSDMGRTEDAERSFRAALSLQQDATLPMRVAPQIRERFEQIRSQIQKESAEKTAAASPPVPRSPPVPQIG